MVRKKKRRTEKNVGDDGKKDDGSERVMVVLAK
jgi:hypothetical protein